MSQSERISFQRWSARLDRRLPLEVDAVGAMLRTERPADWGVTMLWEDIQKWVHYKNTINMQDKCYFHGHGTQRGRNFSRIIKMRKHANMRLVKLTHAEVWGRDGRTRHLCPFGSSWCDLKISRTTVNQNSNVISDQTNYSQINQKILFIKLIDQSTNHFNYD